MFKQTSSGVSIGIKDFSQSLQKKFQLENIEKQKKKRMKMWGWHKLPDNIDCFNVNAESNEVSVPLGIA